MSRYHRQSVWFDLLETIAGIVQGCALFYVLVELVTWMVGA